MQLPPKKRPEPIVDGFTHIKDQRLRAFLCALREVRLLAQWLGLFILGLYGPTLTTWLKTMI